MTVVKSKPKQKDKIFHFEIQADDVSRAIDFYKKTFNWKIKKIINANTKHKKNYWILSTGTVDSFGWVKCGVYKRPKERKKYSCDCTIVVDDLDKIIEKIKKNGGQIKREKMEIEEVGWFAGAIDTENNVFAILQPPKFVL
ncbi:MAG: VOC family protein [Candidatus Magasanikiibacteriota bacterium]